MEEKTIYIGVDPDIDKNGVAVYDREDNSLELRNIPFIFLTAKTESLDFRKGMEMGADDYITKPFDINETVKLVEKASNNLRQAYSQDKINDFLSNLKGLILL